MLIKPLNKYGHKMRKFLEKLGKHVLNITLLCMKKSLPYNIAILCRFLRYFLKKYTINDF